MMIFFITLAPHTASSLYTVNYSRCKATIQCSRMYAANCLMFVSESYFYNSVNLSHYFRNVSILDIHLDHTKTYYVVVSIELEDSIKANTFGNFTGESKLLTNLDELHTHIITY